MSSDAFELDCITNCTAVMWSHLPKQKLEYHEHISYIISVKILWYRKCQQSTHWCVQKAGFRGERLNTGDLKWVFLQFHSVSVVFAFLSLLSAMIKPSWHCLLAWLTFSSITTNWQIPHSTLKQLWSQLLHNCPLLFLMTWGNHSWNFFITSSVSSDSLSSVRAVHTFFSFHFTSKNIIL